MNKTVYFDNQATTPIDTNVLEEMLPYFGPLFGNPHSSDHIIGWRAAQAIEKSLNQIGELIGADENEVVFTSGATEANNLALLGIGRKAHNGNRKRILVSSIEHKCVLEASRRLHEQFGFAVETLPVTREGYIDLNYLEQTLSNEVLLVSIMLVNNEIGTIQDLKTISSLVREHGSLLHSDAAQAPPAMSLAGITEHVDLLSMSGHKMYGPQGVGVLYIRRDAQNLIEPIIYGGEQQRNLRSGTLAVPLCVGMGAAAKRLNDQGRSERELVRKRTLKFIEALSELSHPIELNGSSTFAARHPGNANLQFVGFDAKEILGILQPHVAASTGSACTTGIPEISHVLHAIGLTSEQANSSIRFSLGKNSTDEEVEAVIQLVESVLETLSTHRSG